MTEQRLLDSRPLLLWVWAAALQTLLWAGYDCFWGHVFLVFCVAAHCAVDVVVVVVCAVLGWCGVLGLRLGKCLWLIAHCGWVVLWRDQGGRDAGLM